MKAFYNENDPKAAAWLRELIKEGLIADGVVDERSITEIQPNELDGYAQCHFFAGIGGWSLALRLAGVPDGFRVWTGSCPCQPFSSAGKQRGTDDERHLWPSFFRLIRECGPELVFGEQVASAAVLGSVSNSAQRKTAASAVPVWLDGVFADLESAHYTCGASDIPAAGVGAPHIRQRVFWVADARRAGNERGSRSSETLGAIGGAEGEARERQWSGANPGRGGIAGGMGNTEGFRWNPRGNNEDAAQRDALSTGTASIAGGMGGSHGASQERQRLVGASMESKQEAGRPCNADAWANAAAIQCADGKARRVESGIQPLAHGVPGRVGLLRGYGNAIVPQAAAEFISAALEAIA